MRKDIKINVDTQTDGISLSSRRLGISSENLQGKIIFTPKPFIDGICRMYIEGYGTIEMDKQEDCYTLDIKSSLLITPSIDVCFKITEPEKDNGVPIFATKILHFEVLDTIENNEPIPEQYPQWKDVLDNYAEEKKGELDTYTIEIQTDLKAYKKDLENEMSTTKDTLTGEITATATDETNKFNTNAETKTNAFNDNATEKTTNYNTNAETKLKEYNDNATTKTEEYNTNATNKVNEFNDNVDSLENELTELAGQMPWNTTEIQDSIHVEDSAKYSRNKLELFGNLVQEKRSGKSLVDFSNYVGKASTVEYSFTDDVIIATQKGAQSYAGVSFNILDIIKNNPSKELKFIYETLDVSSFSSDNKRIIQIEMDTTETKKYYGMLDKDNTSTVYTIPADTSNITKAELKILTNNSTGTIETSTVKITKPMLLFTDITDETYEEYGAMPSIDYPSMPVVATGVQKIKRIGKNFLNVEKNASTTVFGATATTDENGIVTINGTTTGAVYLGLVDILKAYSYGESSKLIKSKLCKGVYKVSFKYISGTATSASNNTNIQFRDGLTSASSTIIKSIANLGTSDKAISATLDKDKDFYTYLWADINTTFTNYKFTVHIEKVESETDLVTAYEPYTEETFELDLGTTELCKIVDENNNVVAQDRVAYKDGKWQWEKNIEKVVLDGTQTIASVSASTITTRVQYTNVIQATNIDIRKYSLCNMLNYKSIWSSDEEAYYLDNASVGIVLRIRKDVIGTTRDSVNEYLSNNNLVVYYPLQKTTYEDCTQEQSQVLDKLYKLSLQKGTNNIFVESENGVTTELQLTYMQDLMSQINELKQAMLNIGGN